MINANNRYYAAKIMYVVTVIVLFYCSSENTAVFISKRNMFVKTTLKITFKIKTTCYYKIHVVIIITKPSNGLSTQPILLIKYTLMNYMYMELMNTMC